MARPLYANYVNAEALISLHTDGGVPTARGATVLTKLNDPSSLQLSNNIICYLKEQIHTLEAYAHILFAQHLRRGMKRRKCVRLQCPLR